MDVLYRYGGLDFVWDAHKAASNVAKHGIRFERACEVFFDPLMVSLDVSVDEEVRDGVLGVTELGKLLFVVYIDRDGEAIRIISARAAEPAERNRYENHA